MTTAHVNVIGVKPEDIRVSTAEKHAWVKLGGNSVFHPDPSLPLVDQLLDLATIGERIQELATEILENMGDDEAFAILFLGAHK
jgi:hypothetical protein